jgi:hypothetical protein
LNRRYSRHSTSSTNSLKITPFKTAPGEQKSCHDSQGEDKWGGPQTHKLLSAAYILAFLCLFCVDEVLKIQMHHIEMKGTKLKVTLPFRKTHQLGGKSN